MESWIESRSILWLLAYRELRSRYAGSVLGAFWNMIHPIVLIGIYILVFSSVMTKMGSSGSRGDYVVHLCAGLIPWLVFSESLQRSTSVLIENANFLKKLTFPHEVLHYSVLLNTLMIHTVSALALMFLLWIGGFPLDRKILLAFPLMIGIGFVGTGLGMALSVLNLFLKDIGQFLAIGLQMLFWLTPIVYTPAFIGGTDSKIYYLLSHNPILGYVTGFQKAFGAQQAIFIDDSVYLMVFLPFACVWVGREVLRKQRAELLDLL